MYGYYTPSGLVMYSVVLSDGLHPSFIYAAPSGLGKPEALKGRYLLI
jgi:hypothetical protein